MAVGGDGSWPLHFLREAVGVKAKDQQIRGHPVSAGFLDLRHSLGLCLCDLSDLTLSKEMKRGLRLALCLFTCQD